MKLKICGLKYPENILAIEALQPDFMGFIFYPKSSRYVNILEIKESINQLSKNIQKVAVFVNESPDTILQKIHGLSFDFIQLHGNEPVETALRMKSKGYGIIKAFSIHSNFDWTSTEAYENYCEYFLFDTSTPQYGGSGKKFDWKLIQHYQGQTPFLLSGGISLEDAEEIKKISHPKFAGIDINSRFETEPGLKNISLIQIFIKALPS